jgi:hypothetical protein
LADDFNDFLLFRTEAIFSRHGGIFENSDISINRSGFANGEEEE